MSKITVADVARVDEFLKTLRGRLLEEIDQGKTVQLQVRNCVVPEPSLDGTPPNDWQYLGCAFVALTGAANEQWLASKIIESHRGIIEHSLRGR